MLLFSCQSPTFRLYLVPYVRHICIALKTPVRSTCNLVKLIALLLERYTCTGGASGSLRKILFADIVLVLRGLGSALRHRLILRPRCGSWWLAAPKIQSSGAIRDCPHTVI